MKRKDDPALYRAAERLLAAIQMAGDDGASHYRWQRRALRLIREAMRAAVLAERERGLDALAKLRRMR